MNMLRSRLGVAALAIGLLIGLTWLSSGCGEDPPQVAPVPVTIDQQQTEDQDRAEASGTAESEQRAESAQEQTRPLVESESEQRERAQSDPQETVSTASSDAQQQVLEESQTQTQAQLDAQQQQPQDDSQVAQVMTAEIRLITLFGDLTEIVYALGAEDYLVARDTSSIYPPQAEDLPNLGFAGGLNAEAILDLDPTLVLGTPMAGPPEVLDQLRAAGVEVRIIEDLNGLNAPQIKIRSIGEALGLTEQAEVLATEVGKRMDAVIAASTGDAKPLRVMHIYIRRGGLQLVSGSGNKAETIITAAGAIDAAAEAGIEGWQPLTPEALVSADPDVYLVMDRGLEVIGGIDALLEIPGIAQTRAGEGPYVISMPDLYLLGFGPRMPEAIEDLAEFLREVQEEISGGGGGE